MKDMLKKLISELKSLANPKQAEILQRFFRTKKGEYGEGDIFLGIRVPMQRKIAKKYLDLNLKDIQELLENKIHEYRMIALIILISKYKKSNNLEKEKIFKFYIQNAQRANNWDLVDLSAPNIVGDFLLDKKKDILYKLSKSKNLWEKRIAIVSTYTFMKNNNFKDTIKISEILLKDQHDLIHKAVGWMLREVGKKDKKILEDFLKKHYKQMPRTTLRYSIERFPEDERKKWLNKN